VTEPVLVVESAPASAVARRIEHAFAHRTRDRFALALPGGSIASAVFPLLSAASIDWAKVDLFWGDERAVPPDHPDSNYGVARALLLGVAEAAGASVHRMPADAPNIDVAARDYEALLRGVTEQRGLDFVLAGLGPDGHLCSLFPGHILLEERTRWVASIIDSPKPPPHRLTLTMPALDAATELVVMALGSGKADIVARSVRGEDLPAVRALAREGAVLLVDPSAAPTLAP